MMLLRPKRKNKSRRRRRRRRRPSITFDIRRPLCASWFIK